MNTKSLTSLISPRARLIVKLAAKQSRGSTREWFLRDERGAWEKTAAEYLTSTAEKAAALGLSPKQVNDEIAGRLRLLSLEAQLASAKRHA